MHLIHVMCILVMLTSCAETPKPGKQVLITEGFSNQVVDGYWLYLPKNYDPAKKWPMIMFLQGGDASASPDPKTVKDGGPARYMLQQAKQAMETHVLPDSFVVVNPHMRTGRKENEASWKVLLKLGFTHRSFIQLPETAEQVKLYVLHKVVQ